MKQSAKKRMTLRVTLRKLPAATAVVIALAVAAALTTILYSGLLKAPDSFLSDRLYYRARASEANIYILGIDETALTALGPYQTWTRSNIAGTIELLNANADADKRPAVIGVDVMYFGQTDPESDARLAEACAKGNNVVMATRAHFTTKLVDDGKGAVLDRSAVGFIELPYPGLLAASTIGHINFTPDDDGVIRRAFQYIGLPPDVAEETGLSGLPSFALSVYDKYAEAKGLPKDPGVPVLGRFSEWRIPFSAKPGGFSDNFSIWDVLNGELPADMFAGAIVLIGPYAPGFLDSYVTPVSPLPMYGVEIHANAIDAMVRGVYYADVPVIASAIVTFVILFALLVVYYITRPVVSAFIMLAVSCAYILIAYQMVFPLNENWFLFGNSGNTRYLLPLVQLPLGAAVMYIGMLVLHFISERRQKNQVYSTFSRYVDASIVEDIFKSGVESLQLGGRLCKICVMFVDIRGFTPMSELLEPPEVVTILNEYLEMISNAIFRHNGTLDKFIGDAAMAFWGAPTPQDDVVYKAVLTAWDIVQSCKEKETILREKYGRSVSFGIGINYGDAVVGNIGASRRMDYTAIGNTINTASRLEGVAVAGQILLSEAAFNEVADRICARCAGVVPLKGKSEELTVYALESIIDGKGMV